MVIPRAMTAAVVAAVVGMTPGCRDSARQSGDGGGSGGAQGMGPRMDAAVVDSCARLPTACDGLVVHACIDGQMGPPLATCSDACSLGRCTTQACRRAEQFDQDGVKPDAARGCLFFGVQSDNIDSDDSENLMLVLSNSGVTAATAAIEVRVPDGGWQAQSAVTIPPGAGTRIELNRPMTQGGVTPLGAYRVDSDAPLLAIQIVSDDLDRSARSSGGTALRPVQALGMEYLAVTSPADGSPEVQRTAGSRDGAGAITVVATADTVVHARLTADAIAAPGDALAPAPVEHAFPLHEGDVLQIFSASPHGDLTGSHIEADRPLAVFSGNVFTTYGYDVAGSNGGDLAQEQLPPLSSWHREYFGVRLSPQAGCDPFFGAGSGMWRIVAAETPTTVVLSPAAGASIDGPGLPAGLTFDLAAGESRTFFVRGERSARAVADFRAHATRGRFLLAQWLDCEPGLSWGIDGRLSDGDLVLTMPPGFDHELVVVRGPGSQVSFDGSLISDFQFKPISQDDPTHQVARLDASLLACADTWDSCTHRLSGTRYNVAWRGMDIVCSYSLAIPPSDPCALPTANCPQ